MNSIVLLLFLFTVWLHESKLCFAIYNRTITKYFISCTSYLILPSIYFEQRQTMCKSHFQPTIWTICTF